MLNTTPQKGKITRLVGNLHIEGIELSGVIIPHLLERGYDVEATQTLNAYGITLSEDLKVTRTTDY